MRQIRVTKRPRPREWYAEPLSLDPHDPDIVRAKEFARRAGSAAARARRAGSAAVRARHAPRSGA